ncbi:hypothetical protein [Paenibacillus protaetiae]|uniref:Uncharacterized protein n=1 Tax=Paenibacillus protaetiae TaxID=2509456 RepID=A0A4P6EZ79_9BACL|nr:hypothetical protein [Paenibacillus protaetiae]QAY66017.1 hypothetical protein ET464_06050 [Paenibacillus protaetiae]
MIKYGLDRITELKFEAFYASLERRNEQLVDVELRFALSPATPAPDDLIDFTALVICTVHGDIAQIVPQDIGCDCEYQFTVSEKEQIAAYIYREDVQREIQNLPSPT